MMPEVRICLDPREWHIDARRTPKRVLNGVILRGGFFVAFGPMSLFWPEN